MKLLFAKEMASNFLMPRYGTMPENILIGYVSDTGTALFVRSAMAGMRAIQGGYGWDWESSVVLCN